MNARIAAHGDLVVAGIGGAMKIVMITVMLSVGIGQGLIYIPTLFIMDAWLGATGLAWAQPMADVVSVVMAVVLYGKNFRGVDNMSIKKT